MLDLVYATNEHHREQPLGGSLCGRQDAARRRAGAAEPAAKGLPEPLCCCTAQGVGSSPTQGQWDFQIPSAGLYSHAL